MQDMKFQAIDLGCGPNKRSGALGADHYAYPGVDLVFNLDEMPWPIKSDSFDKVFAHHVIEHVGSIPKFMSEIHRIARKDASVKIVTPHFSSVDSWKDPTHRWHLSARWHTVFCEPQKYLHAQMPGFAEISTEVAFSSNFINIWPRLIIRMAGIKAWEKRNAFKYPAKNISTELRVLK